MSERVSPGRMDRSSESRRRNRKDSRSCLALERHTGLEKLRIVGGLEGRRKAHRRGRASKSPRQVRVSLERSLGDCGSHIHHTLCSNSCPPNGREQFLPPPGTDVHMVKKSPVDSISLLRQKRVLLSSCFIIPDGLPSRSLCFRGLCRQDVSSIGA